MAAKTVDEALFLRIPSNLKKEFKRWCVTHEISMSNAIESLIFAAVKGPEKATISNLLFQSAGLDHAAN